MRRKKIFHSQSRIPGLQPFSLEPSWTLQRRERNRNQLAGPSVTPGIPPPGLYFLWVGLNLKGDRGWESQTPSCSNQKGSSQSIVTLIVRSGETEVQSRSHSPLNGKPRTADNPMCVYVCMCLSACACVHVYVCVSMAVLGCIWLSLCRAELTSEPVSPSQGALDGQLVRLWEGRDGSRKKPCLSFFGF
jgi:hypothetical protein